MNIFYKFTWRSIKQNKVRTIVTILGIMLSVSLITATLTSVSSLFHFLQNVMGEEYGKWHLYVDNLTDSQLSEMKNEDNVDESAVMYNIGYAKLEKSYVADKPYLYVGAYDGNLDAICNFAVNEGRMPQNSSEIILPQGLEESGGVKYEIGDTLKLDLGVRTDDIGHGEGMEIWRFSSYNGGYEGDDETDPYEPEKLTIIGTKAYKVVGKFSCGMFEKMSLAGFTGITKADNEMQARSAAFFATLDDTGGILKESFAEDFYKAHPEYEDNYVIMDVNKDYLRVTDNMDYDLKAMLIGLITMLLVIIAFGSIALIYNSFSISINERKKQYGLLSSIGATKRQLKKSMIFEAVVLSGIGIPLGILLGIGGISTTFYLLQDVFNRFLVGSTGITIEFSASIEAIAIAVVISFVTILLSAWLPARKAVKVSAIEAIRQNDEILIKPRKLRTSSLTQKIFGLEGTLALKNFRRNKRRYRATVFSLFMSIVLFISATSFCDYMGEALGEVRDRYDSDITYRVKRKDMDKAYDALNTVKGVKKSTRHIKGQGMLSVKNDNLTEDTKRFFVEEDEKNDEVCQIPCYCLFVHDEDYAKYLEENGYSKEKYMDEKKPRALIYNGSTQYDSHEKKYVIFNILKKAEMSAVLNVDDKKQDIELGSFCEEVPFGTKEYTGNMPLLYYPMSALPLYEEKLFSGKDEASSLTAYIDFGAEDPDACILSMKKILEAREMDINSLNNNFQAEQSSIALMTVIRVFSNGFIILILLIAMANVFNTVATGIMLRRREFAMMRSIGMTQKGFQRMMNFECLMYGGKGIIYGLPVAILATYGIYRAIRESIMLGFYVPWYGVAIAIGSVFFVVFVTMIYSVHKVNKENVVDVLKEDSF